MKEKFVKLLQFLRLDGLLLGLLEKLKLGIVKTVDFGKRAITKLFASAN